jgi:hypothetical protein
VPWKPVFRKGYVVFRRSGGRNTIIVDLSWRKAPRLAVKLPDNPADLLLANPYPDLEDTGTKTSGNGAGHSARSTSSPTCAPSSRSPGASTHQQARP